MRNCLVLDILYPRRCAICDGVLPFGEKGCHKTCKQTIQYIGATVCCKCGKPVKEEEEYCQDCKMRPHAFDQARALYPYRYVRLSIYRYKYGGRKEYGAFFGREMAEYFENYIKRIHPDALIPVPLHRKRKRKRGFNQAEILAEEIGKILQIPVWKKTVFRVKNTKPMKNVEGNARQNNLKKAFKIRGNDVKLKTIILIDDIYTTGATVDTIAALLKTAGAEKIFVLALSCGT
ncbi:MAG: ComF family protein [Lachnospiraceae bacterium]|nr:ComF family protein [Lachnospiraceae bacterium]